MARRSDHSRDELQRLILDSAISIIREGGKESLTARKVSARTGYVPGTIYNVFGSMDGLIMHINARTLDLLYHELSKPEATKKGDVVENLLKLASAYRKFVADNKNFWLLLFDTSLPDDRIVLDWYQEKVDKLFKLIENIISPVMTKGGPQKLRMVSRILWSSFHGLCYLEEKGQFRTVGKSTNLADMTKLLVESFMAGLQNNKTFSKA